MTNETEKNGTQETDAPKSQVAEIMNFDRGQLERAIQAKGYSEEDANMLRWLHGYALSRGGRKADILAALGGGVEWTTVYRAMVGYDVQKREFDSLLALAARLRAKIEEGLSAAFAETPVTRRIWKALDYARDRGTMVMISGPSGRSKTQTCLRWAAANNHGRTIYVRATSGSSKRSLVMAVARAVGVGAGRARNCGMGELEERIRESIGAHNVIIVDEAGHLFPSGNRGTEALDFLRDLHDMTGCGLALVATDYYYEILDKGKHSVFFEQFIGRIKLNVAIPRRIFKEEIVAAISLFIKDPPEDLVEAVLETAKSDRGHLRPIIQDDLPTLVKSARKLGRAPSPKLWTEVLKYRRTAGAEEWPQE